MRPATAGPARAADVLDGQGGLPDGGLDAVALGGVAARPVVVVVDHLDRLGPAGGHGHPARLATLPSASRRGNRAPTRSTLAPRGSPPQARSPGRRASARSPLAPSAAHRAGAVLVSQGPVSRAAIRSASAPVY